jgi:hypothetical protein
LSRVCEEKLNTKSVYIGFTRSIKKATSAVGLLKVLDSGAANSKFWCWARSLLAIYDLNDLVALDVPWWTFKATSTVEEHLRRFPQAQVFEWGSGASTVWLAKRASSVVTVEHDARWAKMVAEIAPRNVQIMLVETPPLKGFKTEIPSSKSGASGQDFALYVAAIDATSDQFDLIIIDGRAREACLGLALKHLTPEGIIVFDNVERNRYRVAISEHLDAISIFWTKGLTPALPYPSQTALISRKRI